MPEDNDLTRFCKLLGTPERLQLLQLLLAHPGQLCVDELAVRMQIAQPTVSYHLRWFHELCLLDTARDGLYRYYAINTEKLEEYLEGLHRLCRVSTVAGSHSATSTNQGSDGRLVAEAPQALRRHA